MVLCFFDFLRRREVRETLPMTAEESEELQSKLRELGSGELILTEDEQREVYEMLSRGQDRTSMYREFAREAKRWVSESRRS